MGKLLYSVLLSVALMLLVLLGRITRGTKVYSFGSYIVSFRFKMPLSLTNVWLEKNSLRGTAKADTGDINVRVEIGRIYFRIIEGSALTRPIPRFSIVAEEIDILSVRSGKFQSRRTSYQARRSDSIKSYAKKKLLWLLWLFRMALSCVFVAIPFGGIELKQCSVVMLESQDRDARLLEYSHDYAFISPLSDKNSKYRLTPASRGMCNGLSLLKKQKISATLRNPRLKVRDTMVELEDSMHIVFEVFNWYSWNTKKLNIFLAAAAKRIIVSSLAQKSVEIDESPYLGASVNSRVLSRASPGALVSQVIGEVISRLEGLPSMSFALKTEALLIKHPRLIEIKSIDVEATLNTKAGELIVDISLASMLSHARSNYSCGKSEFLYAERGSTEILAKMRNTGASAFSSMDKCPPLCTVRADSHFQVLKLQHNSPLLKGLRENPPSHGIGSPVLSNLECRHEVPESTCTLIEVTMALSAGSTILLYRDETLPLCALLKDFCINGSLGLGPFSEQQPEAFAYAEINSSAAEARLSIRSAKDADGGLPGFTTKDSSRSLLSLRNVSANLPPLSICLCTGSLQIGCVKSISSALKVCSKFILLNQEELFEVNDLDELCLRREIYDVLEPFSRSRDENDRGTPPALSGSVVSGRIFETVLFSVDFLAVILHSANLVCGLAIYFDKISFEYSIDRSLGKNIKLNVSTASIASYKKRKRYLEDISAQQYDRQRVTKARIELQALEISLAKDPNAAQMYPEEPGTKFSIESISIHLDLTYVYLLMDSLMPFIRLNNQFGDRPPRDASDSGVMLPNVCGLVHSFQSSVNLYENAVLLTSMQSTKISVLNGAFEIFSSVISFNVPEMNLPNNLEFLTLKRFSLKTLLNARKERPFSASVDHLIVYISHEYKMYRILLSLSIFSKCLRRIYDAYFSDTYCALSSYNLDISSPKSSSYVLNLMVGKVEIAITSDWFSDRIYRNYLLGLTEQSCRLKREKEVGKRIRNLEKKEGGSDNQSLKKKIELIQEKVRMYNSEVWRKCVYDHESKRSGYIPKLISVVSNNVSLTLRSLEIPEMSIGAYIHKLDPVTPSSSYWNTVISVYICLKVNDLVVKLRDYPHDFLNVPSSTSGSIKCKGAIIIVDKFPKRNARQQYTINLSHIRLSPLRVTRNVNPIMVYHDLHTDIDVAEPTTFTWGASYDPSLIDFIDVVDSFAVIKEDLSPHLGWWDKMRLTFHGKNRIHLSEGTDICFRILGSFAPHFRSDVDWGAEGVELCVNGATDLEIDSVNEAKITTSGFIVRLIPESYLTKEDMESPRIWGNKIIMKLCGDVTAVISLKFVTAVEDADGSICVRTHDDIHLVRSSLLEKDQVQGYDSYKGFRTRGIKVVANLTCNEASPLSLNNINNFFSLFNYAITEKMSQMSYVYQPPLVNVLTKFKYRRDSNSECNKPVFLQFLESVYASVEISPLKALIFSERDDFSEIKVKATTEKFTSEVLVTRKCQSAPGISDTSIGDQTGSSSSQWTIPRLTMTFSNIVGWVSCVPLVVTNESSPYDTDNYHLSPSAVDEDKFKIMEEVYNTTDPIQSEPDTCIHTSKKKIPFIWSKDVIYSVKPTSGLYFPYELETGADSEFTYPGIYPTQIKICEDRLRTVSLVMDEVRNDIRSQLGSKKIGFSTSNSAEILKNLGINMEILQEKISYYREQERKRNRFSHNPSVSKDNNGELEDSGVHNKTYRNEVLVHNIKILWNKEVRDIIYNLVFWKADRKDENFCASVFSLKSVYGLVESMSRALGSFKSIESSRRVSAMLKPKFTFKKKSNDSHYSHWTFENARCLLDKLDSERDVSFIAYEDTGTINRASSRFAESVKNTGDSEGVHDNNMAEDSYTPVKSVVTCNSDYCDTPSAYPHLKVEFINPQVCLNSRSSENVSEENYAHATGDRILFYLDHILQSDIPSSSLRAGDDIEKITVKSKICATMYNAQFYAGSKVSIMNKYLSDIEGAITAAASRYDEVNSDLEIPWVPIERILDSRAPLTYLDCVAESKIALFKYVWPNVLFTKLSSSQSESDHMEKKKFSIPELEIRLGPDQYSIICDIITNLLLYEHPRANENNNRLQSALIFLEKIPDMLIVLENAFVLGEKIRSIKAALKGELYSRMTFSTNPPSSELLNNYNNLRKDLREYQTELNVIVNALKTIHSYMSNVRADISVYKEFAVSVNKGSWIMNNSAGTPFAECKLNNLTTGYTMFHGKSLLNYLELDYLNMKYLDSSYPFENDSVVAPYVPEKNNINFSRHKVIRVYWKENAPVTGIKVIEHFEINLLPISLKLTYSSGKNILRYFFPQKSSYQGLKPHKSKKVETPQSHLPNEPRTTGMHGHVNRDLKSSEYNTAKDQSKSILAGDKSAILAVASYSSLPAISQYQHNTSGGSSYLNLKLGIPALKNIRQGSKSKRYSGVDSTDASVHSKAVERQSYSQIIKDINDIKQMQARAKEYRSFIYIKIPGVEHCLSYRRSSDKNFEDLDNFLFRFPTLEFRNKTWSWTDLFYAVKKECLRVLIINTGAIVKEKIFSRKRIDKK